VLTRKETMTSGGIDGYSNFTGDDDDYKDWYGIAGQSRDSGCLEQSNFKNAVEMLGGESDDVRIERFGHWAVGWIEEVYVRPGSKAYDIALDIEQRLEDYPVLNEDDYCDMEHEEADRIWADCYNVRERIEYVRENRSQFDFNDFADMLGCIRGKYFSGYSSELIG